MAKKIDPKLDHFFDVSWDRCLGGIWWIFGAKMEPSWHQNGIKHQFFRKHEKNAFGASPLVPDWVQGVQVGSNNRSKIDPKMEPKMECILASIFDTFQWMLGSKLGSKMDQKSIQKGIGKRSLIFHWFCEVWGGEAENYLKKIRFTKKYSGSLKK